MAVVDLLEWIAVLTRMELERGARERSKIQTLLDPFKGLRLERYDVINKHDLT